MEKEHKELLIIQRANLVENLNMRSGLFTQLLCRKIIDQRMVRKIKNGNTEDEQAEELLDYLPKSEQGKETFNLFCEALIADSQSMIVNTYLRSDNHKEAEKHVEESTSSASVSSKNETTSTVPAETVCQQEQDGGLPGQGTPLAIREEFQHQLYRRTIQPSDIHRSQSSPVMETNSESEARYFLENHLRNPTAVYQILNDRCSSRVEKERQLFDLGLPLSSISGLMHNVTDALLARDSPSKLQKCMSSKDFTEHPFAHSPSVFHMSPQKEISLSSMNTSQSPHAHRAFMFQTKDNIPYSSQSMLETDSFRSVKASEVNEENRDRESIPNVYRQSNIGQTRNIDGQLMYRKDDSCNGNPRPSLPQYSSSMSQEIHSSAASPGKMIEMERYIEVSGNGENLPRSVVSFPRHVTMLPVSHHTDISKAELNRGENLPSRLVRNDSLDTMQNVMQKRPLEEKLEDRGKRFREDVDTCSVPSYIKPDNFPVVKIIDTPIQQVVNIPVFEQFGKKPSLPAVVVENDEHLEKRQRSSLLGAMDDPEIDLTDGPINVNVELSTRQFYLAHYKQAYAMRRIPRGKALIINVNEVVGKSARRGTDIDRDNLHNLLCQMHFDVTVYNDTDGLTAMEMVQKLQDFSQHTSHAQGDSTVVCILSHGEEGYIFGADGKKFELDAVFSLFDNTCCPNLRGKPKIFIIQACRGGALDRGVQYYPDEHDGSDARVRQVPSMSDMLICYPTQNGYYAWRNRDRGSWYVEALVQVFMKYARCEDVCTMLNRVNLLVSKKVSHCPNIDMDQMSQMSEYKSTLRMPHLYFFPGIGGCS